MHRVSSFSAFILLLAIPCTAQPIATTPGFAAVDIFGIFTSHVGYGSADAPTEEERARFNGWDLGTSFRPLPWLAVTGTVGRTWNGDTRLMHYVAGPRVTTSYGGNYYGVRSFAHFLAGAASGRSADLPADTGLEIVAGGGFDFWYVLRMQFDYVRLPILTGPGGIPLKRNQVRIALGGVVPFCFRGCRPNDVDGINLSK